MNKNKIICLFENCRQTIDGIGSEQLEADIAGIIEELAYDAQDGDEASKAVVRILEREELPARERLVQARKLLEADFDSIKAELASIEPVIDKLVSHVDAFFVGRGYTSIEKGVYQKRDGGVYKGLNLDISAFFYNDRPSIEGCIVCKRAKVRRGKVRVCSAEYEFKRIGNKVSSKLKRRVKVLPAEGFDIFGDHGFIPDNMLRDSDLKSRTVHLPYIAFHEADEAIDYDLDAPSVISTAYVKSADEAFEVLLPYLNGACSLLDRKKPNKEFIKAYNGASYKLTPRTLLMLLAILAAAGLLFGFFMAAAFFMLDVAIGGNTLPVSYFVKMGLQCGAAFAILSGALMLIIALLQRRKLYF